QLLRRIVRRIDRYEQNLHPIGIGTERLVQRRELRERRRTDIGAMRVTEEEHQHLAAEVGGGNRFTGMSLQGYVSAPIDARYVHALKRRFGRRARGKQ